MFLVFVLFSDTTIKEVMVEGVSSIEGGRKDIARDHAIKDALRKAVEQAVGTFISSETVVENYEVLSDRIYSKAEGYVAEYKVLREKKEGDLYRVLISAKVKMGDIKDDLKAIGILVEYLGRPRIAVLLEDEDIRGTIEDQFVSLGFPIVDFKTIQKNTEKDKLKAVIEGDENLAKEIALRNGAEVFVIGSSKVMEGDYRGKKVYEVVIRAKVVESSTGNIISSKVLTKKLPFDEMKAKVESAKEIANLLSDEILKNWKGSPRVVYLKVYNAGNKVKSIKEEISRKVRGVRSVNVKEIRKNYAVFEIITNSTVQEVFDDISEIDGFEVLRFEGSEIEVRYLKKKGKT